MIQRIQTLYLVAGAILLAAFVGVQAMWASLFEGDVAVLGTVVLAVAVLAAVLALVAVGLYKNRALQRRLISWALWADLVVVAGVLGGLFLAMQAGETIPSGVMLTAIAPVVAYVLLRLARSGVDRDIATVRSMDRIR